MKILFAIILGIIFLFCFTALFFGNFNTNALIAFTPVSFIAFFGYLASQFLGLDINLPAISIRKRVSYLESNQKELKHIVTAFYKFQLMSITMQNMSVGKEKLAKKHNEIAEEIKEYIGDDIKDFMIELLYIKEHPFGEK